MLCKPVTAWIIRLDVPFGCTADQVSRPRDQTNYFLRDLEESSGYDRFSAEVRGIGESSYPPQFFLLGESGKPSTCVEESDILSCTVSAEVGSRYITNSPSTCTLSGP